MITGLSLYGYDPRTLAIIGNAVAGADLTVSPVPEAPFYAMLLMGLAGGALAREGGFSVRLNKVQGARR